MSITGVAIECNVEQKEANMLIRLGKHYEKDSFRHVELIFLPSEYNTPSITLCYDDLQKAIEILESGGE